MSMRIQLGISVVIMILALGCDEPVVALERDARGPHPYLSCIAGELDPVCEGGCGDAGDSLEAYTVCAIPCSDVSGCEVYGGPSVSACVEGRCYYFCESDSDCPSGLECVDRGGASWPDKPYPELGECKAVGEPAI